MTADQSSLTVKEGAIAGNKRSISLDSDELIRPDSDTNINDHSDLEQDMISSNLSSAELQQNPEPPLKKIKHLSIDSKYIYICRFRIS